MSATLLPAVAAAIKTRLDTIAALRRVYAYEPRDLDVLPAASILGPTALTRSAVDVEPEPQLGSEGWWTGWTVRIYVALDDPETAQTQLRALLGQAIAALDADQTLGAYALDTKLTSAELGFSDADEQRQLAIFTCTVESLLLVA